MSRVGPLRFIEPQLASPVEQPPEGQHWITKSNVTAFAAKLLIEHRGAHVFTRNGYDWSDRYPSIARAASSFRCQSAVIDGEAIVQDGNGASDFRLTKLGYVLASRKHHSLRLRSDASRWEKLPAASALGSALNIEGFA